MASSTRRHSQEKYSRIFERRHFKNKLSITLRCVGLAHTYSSIHIFTISNGKPRFIGIGNVVHVLKREKKGVICAINLERGEEGFSDCQHLSHGLRWAVDLTGAQTWLHKKQVRKVHTVFTFWKQGCTSLQSYHDVTSFYICNIISVGAKMNGLLRNRADESNSSPGYLEDRGFAWLKCKNNLQQSKPSGSHRLYGQWSEIAMQFALFLCYDMTWKSSITVWIRSSLGSRKRSPPLSEDYFCATEDWNSLPEDVRQASSHVQGPAEDQAFWPSSMAAETFYLGSICLIISMHFYAELWLLPMVLTFMLSCFNVAVYLCLVRHIQLHCTL